MRITRFEEKKMYLHVGNDKLIKKKNIIGIFDLDTATVSPVTREFLKKSQHDGSVESAIDELPKSFILYVDTAAGNCRVCTSQISSGILAGRARSGWWQDNETKRQDNT